MGRKCRHRKTMRFVWDLSGNRAHRWLGAYASDDTHAVICQRCGAWLSLGPSNDSPEAVQEEIEAARLAAHLQHDDFPDDEPEDEWADYGWASHQLDCDVYDGTWHGYLARQITHHDNEAA